MSNSLTSAKNAEDNKFNYDALDLDTREFVEKQAIAIKVIYARTLRDAWEAGRLLLEVKEKLEHGQFCRWVADELGLSRSTACNQMRLAQSFNCATVAQMDLPVSTFYELARSSTPCSARDEVIQRSQAGEKITTTITRQIIARHKSQASEEATSRNSLPDPIPSEVTIDVHCTDVTDHYPDNVVHFRSKSQNRSETNSCAFHAICLFTSLNSLSLQIMQFAMDGRKSC